MNSLDLPPKPYNHTLRILGDVIFQSYVSCLFLHVAREFPRHCNDFSKMIKPPKDSRMTIIQPDDGEPFPVYCEMNKFGGGWTRILYRGSARMTFYRDWYSYKTGFGDLVSDGWLGLEKIHRLTKYNSAELLVSVYAKDGKYYFPEYKYFRVGSEATKYQLYIGNFTGDGGDSLSFSHNAKFSTYDQDHDSSSSNCASSYRGGWWYYNCAQGKLTGEPYASSTSYNYVKWPGASSYALYHATMEIRPY